MSKICMQSSDKTVCGEKVKDIKPESLTKSTLTVTCTACNEKLAVVSWPIK